jgi:hypothetical protein
VKLKIIFQPYSALVPAYAYHFYIHTLFTYINCEKKVINPLRQNILNSLKIYLAVIRFVGGKSTVKKVKTFTFAAVGPRVTA